MVKRDDAAETSLGSVRDTVVTPVQPANETDASDSSDRDEGWYKPEMGTVLVERQTLEDEI